MQGPAVFWGAEGVSYRGSVEEVEDGMVLVYYECDRKYVWHNFGKDSCTYKLIEPAAHTLSQI